MMTQPASSVANRRTLETWLQTNEQLIEKHAQNYLSQWITTKNRVPFRRECDALMEDCLADLRGYVFRSLPQQFSLREKKRIANQIADRLSPKLNQLLIDTIQDDPQRKYSKMISALCGLGLFCIFMVTIYASLVAPTVQMRWMLNTINLMDITSLMMFALVFSDSYSPRLLTKDRSRLTLTTIVNRIGFYRPERQNSLGLSVDHIYQPQPQQIDVHNESQESQEIKGESVKPANDAPLAAKFPHSTPEELHKHFFGKPSTRRDVLAMLRAQRALTAETEEKPTAPVAAPTHDVSDGHGTTYVHIDNKSGHYVRYNPDHAHEQLQQISQPGALSNVREAIYNRRVDEVNAGKKGIVKVSQPEKDRGEYKTDYKLRVGGHTGIRWGISQRAATNDEKQLSPDIQTVYDLEEVRKHPKRKK